MQMNTAQEKNPGRVNTSLFLVLKHIDAQMGMDFTASISNNEVLQSSETSLCDGVVFNTTECQKLVERRGPNVHFEVSNVISD